MAPCCSSCFHEAHSGRVGPIASADTPAPRHHRVSSSEARAHPRPLPRQARPPRVPSSSQALVRAAASVRDSRSTNRRPPWTLQHAASPVLPPEELAPSASSQADAEEEAPARWPAAQANPRRRRGRLLLWSPALGAPLPLRPSSPSASLPVALPRARTQTVSRRRRLVQSSMARSVASRLCCCRMSMSRSSLSANSGDVRALSSHSRLAFACSLRAANAHKGGGASPELAVSRQRY
eukprot:scaffold3830_cov324-Prasinococcus_capsulatus_cf.AAC.3